MKTAHQLRDERAELAEELDMIVEIAKEEKRDLTAKESTRSDEILAELDSLDADIKRRDAIESRLAAKREADSNGPTEIRHKREPQTEEKKVVKRWSVLRAANSLLNKDGKLDGVEAEMHQEAANEMRYLSLSPQGVAVPSFFFRDPRQQRDMTATGGTNGDQGGNTIQTNVGSMIDYLWPRMTVQNLGADMMTGLTSNISMPREATVPTATWEGETDEGAESSPTTDTVSLSPKRVGTFVDVSRQLLIQTQVPGLEARIRRNIEKSIGQAVDTVALNGSGSAPIPRGILNTSGIGSVAIGATGGTPDWGNIVDLEASIASANADMGSLAYLTTPGIRGLLKTTEKATNTGMFIWENAVMGGVQSPTVGEGQLNGYRAAISTLVPSNLTKSSGINLHAIIFGNWNDLIIGQFGGMDIIVDQYTQATKTMVRLVVNSWWDVAIAHAVSFAAIKDASAGEFNT